MAVSQTMRRLFSIREIEEEHRRTALAAANADLQRLQTALHTTVERDRRGRKLVTASACSNELTDRLAGIEESRAAKHHAKVLQPRIQEAETAVVARRQELIDKRIERRQVETLIQMQESALAIESSRRAQKTLDDWYLSRRLRNRKTNSGQRGS
jgi:flagellar biosynthesis chaperone FliJ